MQKDSVHAASGKRGLIPEEVLACDPFAGDFGGPGDRILKDKLGIARKPGPCQDCGCTIQPGTTVRIRAEIVDGDLMSFRWCTECCEAMAASRTDGGAAIEARIALRRNPGINPNSREDLLKAERPLAAQSGTNQ